MGDAHFAIDFHFLFLNPPALTNFTDDQRPLAEEKHCTAVRERHVGRPLERTRNCRFEVDSNSFFEVSDPKHDIFSDFVQFIKDNTL